MTEINLFFEGQRRDLNDLAFAIFDHELRYEVPREVPGEATLTLQMEPLRKSVGHALMEMALNMGEGFVAGVFANWLCSKWQKSGGVRVSVKIENRSYQFDADVLTRALEDVGKKQIRKKAAATISQAPSGNRRASGDQQGRKKSRL